jgi:hypothetical protein
MLKSEDKKLNLVLCMLLLFGLNCLVCAEAIPELGARALGLGGSFVAVGEGMLASYWNPAGMNRFGGVGVQVNAGTGMDLTGGILNFVEVLEDTAASLDEIQNLEGGGYPSFETVQSFCQLLEGLNGLNDPDKGMLSQTPGGVSVCLGPVTMAVNGFLSVGIDPSVDLNNIGFESFSHAGLPGSSSFSSFLSNSKDSSEIPFSTVEISTEPPSGELLESRGDLIDFIDLLIEEGELDMEEFEGYTSTQIANAIINGAIDEGVPPDEIVEIIDVIEDMGPLVEEILGESGDPSGDNTSNLVVKVLGIVELVLGYSAPCGFLDETFLRGLVFGVNLKYLHARTGYFKIGISTAGSGMPEGGYTIDDIKESEGFGLDVGFLLDRKKGHGMRMGVVLKNIITPKFEVSADAKADGVECYELFPQIRFGFAFWPINFWMITADIDLTKNSTFIPDYYSQMVSLGTEVNIPNADPLFNIALRAGAKWNMAVPGRDINAAIEDNKLIYTAGVGVNFATFSIDLSASFNNNMSFQSSTKLEELLMPLRDYIAVDGVPPGVQLALSVSIRFGKSTKAAARRRRAPYYPRRRIPRYLDYYEDDMDYYEDDMDYYEDDLYYYDDY